MIDQQQLAVLGPFIGYLPKIDFFVKTLLTQIPIVFDGVKISGKTLFLLDFIQITRFCFGQPDQQLHLVAIDKAIVVLMMQTLDKGI